MTYSSTVAEVIRLRRTVGAVESATRVHLRYHGLNIGEFLLLTALSNEAEHTARCTHLAQKIGVTTGGVTRLVDRAVLHGFVQRKACEDDARGALVWLTPLGHQRLEAATPSFTSIVWKLLQPEGAR